MGTLVVEIQQPEKGVEVELVAPRKMYLQEVMTHPKETKIPGSITSWHELEFWEQNQLMIYKERFVDYYTTCKSFLLYQVELTS